jgi:hypothetical protein
LTFSINKSCTTKCHLGAGKCPKKSPLKQKQFENRNQPGWRFAHFVFVWPSWLLKWTTLAAPAARSDHFKGGWGWHKGGNFKGKKDSIIKTYHVRCLYN